MSAVRKAMQTDPLDAPSAFVQSVNILGGLLGPSLELVLGCLRRRELPTGAILFSEGDAARGLYVVERGAVQISQSDLVLRLVESGGSFGEMALLDVLPRAATARACCPTTVLELPYSALAAVQAADPEAFTLLIMNLAREVSRRLRRTQQRLAQTSRPPARGPRELRARVCRKGSSPARPRRACRPAPRP